MKLEPCGLAILTLLTGCFVDDAAPHESQVEESLASVNKLGANKLGANKLGANKLAASTLSSAPLGTSTLMATADGREVLSFIVGCALSPTQSLTVVASGVTYTYPGLIGLAPAWATRVPTVSERRWVTACLLSRTNLYGVQVSISMRHDTNPALASTSAELQSYKTIEGAFYGDLFATTPVMYACAAKDYIKSLNQGVESVRSCTRSTDGGLTTLCGFTYTSLCNNSVGVRAPACTDKSSPFGGCKGGSTTYAEVITIVLQ